MVKYVVPGPLGSSDYKDRFSDRTGFSFHNQGVALRTEAPGPLSMRQFDRDEVRRLERQKLIGFAKSSKVAVVVGGATSGNPFGHVALAVEGYGVFSFGTNTPIGSDLTSYLSKQSAYRSTTVYVIPVTSVQAQTMANYMHSQISIPLPDPKSNNKAFVDTCAARTVGALMAAGFQDPMPTLFGTGPSIFPRSAANFGREYGTAHKIPQGGKSSDLFEVFRVKN